MPRCREDLKFQRSRTHFFVGPKESVELTTIGGEVLRQIKDIFEGLLHYNDFASDTRFRSREAAL